MRVNADARVPLHHSDVVAARARHAVTPLLGPAGPGSLLRLQRTAGNAATLHLLNVQRCGPIPPGQCPCHDSDRETELKPVQRLTAAERAINLSSATYAGDVRLEAAFDNAPGMRLGETGAPVGRCQQGLMADGFAMPRSITPAGPDGLFQAETHAAVQGFQAKHRLTIDGVIGRQTLGKLDELATVRAPQVVALPGTGFTVSGKFGGAAAQPNKIFFERSSALPDPIELAKIPALATPANRALTLKGFASEDEPNRAPLANSRLALVNGSFAAAHHTGARTKDPRPDAGLGQLNYRSMRMVEVVPAGAASTTPNCQAGPQYDCGPVPNAYSTANTRADTMLGGVIGQLGTPPSAQAAILLRQLFGSVAARTQVKRNLELIRAHLAVLNAPASHRCATDTCDGSCGVAIAYVDGQTGNMVVCQSFMGKGLDDRAGTLIHEGAHATPSLSADDVAYRFERMTKFLSTRDALNNADSYMLFVRNVDSPGSVTIGPGPGHQDTFAGFTGSRRQAEELAAERATAFVANWLIAGDSETANLYETIKAARRAGAWANSYYERLMGFAARRFNLTVPPAVPPATDQHNVAGINFRYSRLARAAGQGLTFTRTAAGVDTWAPGPGTHVTLTNAFFRLSARRQVDLLLTMIIQASPDIEAAHQQPYVVFTEDMRRHVGRPAP